MERPFSCRCQPTNDVPSYSRISLKRGIRSRGGLAAGSGGDSFVEDLVDAGLAAAGDIEAQTAARLVGGAEGWAGREHHLPRQSVAGDGGGADAVWQARPHTKAPAPLETGDEAVAAHA